MTVDTPIGEKIIECVDTALERALGGSAKYVIYFYLEKDFGLKKNEIHEKPETFCRGVSSIFGEEGAKIIEECIIQKMKQSFKLKQRHKSTFVEVILTIKGRQK